MLNAITIWIAIIFTMFFFTILFRFIYKKLGPKASLKAGLGLLSLIITLKLERRKNNKVGKLKPSLTVSELLKTGNERTN